MPVLTEEGGRGIRKDPEDWEKMLTGMKGCTGKRPPYRGD